MSLKVRRYSEEPWESMPGEGNMGVDSVMLVDEIPVDSYSCRVMRIKPGGGTGMHSHPRAHVVVALSGKTLVETGRDELELSVGSTVSIPGGMPHRFVNNTGQLTTIMVQNLFPRPGGS